MSLKDEAISRESERAEAATDGGIHWLLATVSGCSVGVRCVSVDPGPGKTQEYQWQGRHKPQTTNHPPPFLFRSGPSFRLPPFLCSLFALPSSGHPPVRSSANLSGWFRRTKGPPREPQAVRTVYSSAVAVAVSPAASPNHGASRTKENTYLRSKATIRWIFYSDGPSQVEIPPRDLPHP